MITFYNTSFKYKNSVNVNLKNISFHITRGECVLFTGKSGCGKTTVFRILNGLIPNYYEGKLQGDVHIEGTSIINKKIDSISDKVSSVLQNPKAQFFNIDTTSEILFSLENRGFSIAKMQSRLMEVVNLFEIHSLLDRSVFDLSGGEKQVLALASAFTSDTNIILLDEPTSNLDLFFIKRIKMMLAKLIEIGKTIIIFEHRFFFLKDLVDTVFYLENGRLTRIYSNVEFKNMSKKDREEKGLRAFSLSEFKYDKRKRTEKETLPSFNIKSLKFNKKNKYLNICDLSAFFGEKFGIVGKNGSGKSTFLEALSGITPCNTDLVYLSGNKLSSLARRKISYLVFQDVNYQIFTENVCDEIELGVSIKKGEMNDILSEFNLSDIVDVHPLTLSEGEKQRMIIASGIISGGNILLFDEPTSGMDYWNMSKISEIINKTSSPLNIVFIVTHDLEFLCKTCDKYIVIEKGKVAYIDKINESSIRNLYRYLTS